MRGSIVECELIRVVSVQYNDPKSDFCVYTSDT